jgi:hypothetical protein
MFFDVMARKMRVNYPPLPTSTKKEIWNDDAGFEGEYLAHINTIKNLVKYSNISQLVMVCVQSFC